MKTLFMASLRAMWVWVAGSPRGQFNEEDSVAGCRCCASGQPAFTVRTIHKHRWTAVIDRRRIDRWIPLSWKQFWPLKIPDGNLGASVDKLWEAKCSAAHSSSFFHLMLARGWPVTQFLGNFRVGLSRSLWKSSLFPKRLKKDVTLLFLWKLSWQCGNSICCSHFIISNWTQPWLKGRRAPRVVWLRETFLNGSLHVFVGTCSWHWYIFYCGHVCLFSKHSLCL